MEQRFQWLHMTKNTRLVQKVTKETIETTNPAKEEKSDVHSTLF